MACQGGAGAQVQTAAGSYTVKAGQARLLTPSNAAGTVIELPQSRTILDWSSLGLNGGQSLQFNQSGAHSVVLNRVSGSQSTAIDGRLLSNGQVWIVNPQGVFFGAGSEVNVQGLLATTQSIAEQDFLSGRYHFTGARAGGVVNLGQLVARDGGYVILAGAQVSNQGSVQARLGQVVLASGKSFTLDLAGDGLLRFDVTTALTGADTQWAQVLNSGVLQADGGRVSLMARAAQDLTARVVNTGGLVQANSVRQVQGEIVLDAGPGGGNEIAGQVLAQGLEVGAAGGRITVLGDRIDLKSAARLDASGQVGGGRVLVGGDWQGRGALPQASSVNMAVEAEIKANALDRGAGGQVVLWSDVYRAGGQTQVAGRIEAQGGPMAGDGGQIETSGRALTIAGSARVNAGSVAGRPGQWLLDPVNVTIDASNSGSIENALANNHVLVTTTGANPNWSVGGTAFVNLHGAESGNEGNIFVDVPLTWTRNILSLQAHGNVYVKAPLTAGATFDPGLNTTLFAGLHVRTGYSTPGVDGGTYDSSKVLQFGTNASGFTGKLHLLGTDGLPRSGGGFFLNDVNYTVINSLSQLQNMANDLSGNFALAGAIDALPTQSWNSGLGFAPIGSSSTPFTGRFNGLGHAVSNLSMDRTSGAGGQNIGLFGWNAGTINNVGVVGGSVRGGSSVGALVGTNTGQVNNSYATSSVTAVVSVAGGLVGSNGSVAITSPAVVSNSFASGAVSSVHVAGGLVGMNYASVVRDSQASGSVSGSGNAIGGLIGQTTGVSTLPGVVGTVERSQATGAVMGLNHVGGLVGWNEQTLVTYSHYASNSNAITASNTSAGGLLGVNSVGGTVSNSSASAVVNAYSFSGGLVGSNIEGAVISNSRSLPVATASPAQVNAYSNVGGLAGQNADSSILNSSSAVIVGGMNNVGGLVGLNYASNAKTALISASYSTGLVRGGGYNNGQPWGIFHGGLVGVNQNAGGTATISNSYSSSGVSSVVGLAGGLVGINTGVPGNSVVENSYATGTVSVLLTEPAGGLVGLNEATIRNSYTSSAVYRSGIETLGVLVGRNEPAGVISSAYAPTGAALKSSTTYAGFDFGASGAWSIYQGMTAPLLRSFLTPLTVTVSAPTVTVQTYNGSSAYAGSVSVSYSQSVNSSLLGSLTYQLSSKDAGDRTLQLAGLYSDQQGYLISYANQVGVIRVDPKVLTVQGAAAANKVYDGTMAATVTDPGFVSTGVAAETLQLITGAISASFGDSEVGTAKPVTVNGYSLADGTGGGLASNYTLAGAALARADIVQPLATKPAVASLTSAVNDVVSSATSSLSSTAVAVVVPPTASAGSVVASISSPSTVAPQAAPVLNTAAGPAIVTSAAPTAATSITALPATTVTTATTTPVSFSSEGVQVASVPISLTPAATLPPVVAAPEGSSAPSSGQANSSAESRASAAPVRPSTSTVVARALEQGAANAGGGRMVVVSVDTGQVAVPTLVGAPTLRAPEIPKTLEEQRDPVLAALPVRSAPATATAAPLAAGSGLALGSTSQQISASLSGLANFETTLPRSSATSAEDYRFSVSGNRSRW